MNSFERQAMRDMLAPHLGDSVHMLDDTELVDAASSLVQMLHQAGVPTSDEPEVDDAITREHAAEMVIRDGITHLDHERDPTVPEGGMIVWLRTTRAATADDIVGCRDYGDFIRVVMADGRRHDLQYME